LTVRAVAAPLSVVGKRLAHEHSSLLLSSSAAGMLRSTTLLRQLNPVFATQQLRFFAAAGTAR